MRYAKTKSKRAYHDHLFVFCKCHTGRGASVGFNNKMRGHTEKGMKCDCGFKFSEPGEFRNCEAGIDENGHSFVVCPKCGTRWFTKD